LHFEEQHEKLDLKIKDCIVVKYTWIYVRNHQLKILIDISIDYKHKFIYGSKLGI